ncbi:hypothetical protein GCM10009760_61030 [Kitasatospora kazusensis]|uniref:Secreted protein n=1 Tax=Kitasatospora kazusensis TaxID=407974 RepID=A0ABP5M1I8_9ACTN
MTLRLRRVPLARLPACSFLVFVGTVVSQLRAGRAESRCQQVRKASRQGQLLLRENPPHTARQTVTRRSDRTGCDGTTDHDGKPSAAGRRHPAAGHCQNTDATAPPLPRSNPVGEKLRSSRTLTERHRRRMLRLPDGGGESALATAALRAGVVRLAHAYGVPSAPRD